MKQLVILLPLLLFTGIILAAAGMQSDNILAATGIQTGNILAAAGMSIEIIPLQNRSVDELVPVIRPLLTKGGTVTGMNNQLIIKTEPENLEEIRRIIETLDRPLRRLLITLKQDISTLGRRAGASVSGSLHSGDLDMDATDSRRGAGAEPSGGLHLGTGVSSKGVSDSNDFRLQTVEGQAAFIQTGQAIPVENRNAWVTGKGIVVQETVEYLELGSGFYVLPMLNGELVTLYISPRMERLRETPGGQPVFDIQNAETTVRGRIGEWITLGGIDHTSSRRENGLLYGTRSHQEEQRTMAILVEEIH